MPISLETQSRLATHFRSLHIPGDPILLANVHDAHTATLVSTHKTCRAIATASFSIAATQGYADAELPLSANLLGIQNVLRGIDNAGLSETMPVSVDLQDGYADVRESVTEVVRLGAVGINLEDVDNGEGVLRSVADAVDRVRIAVQAAKELGVEDFVVNARTDVLGYGGGVEEVIERGKRFLEVGAACVFVWWVGVRHLSYEDVETICKELGGRVSVHGPGPAVLSVEELRRAGVCRISVGPWCWRKAMERFGNEAKELLDS